MPYMRKHTIPAEPATAHRLLGRMDGGGGSHSFEGDDRGIDDFAGDDRSLRDHLGEQLRLNFSDPVDRMIGAHLIALLCPAGRLTAEPRAIATGHGPAAGAGRSGSRADDAVRSRGSVRPRSARSVWRRSWRNATGSIRRCRRLLDNLDLLAKRENRRLMALCGVDAEDLTDMIAEIKALDPKPAATWDTTPPQLVVPDLLMRQLPDESWIIELNPETMPRVLVNERFYAKVAPQAKKDEKVFLTERLANANWLVRSLQQRAQTILKVAAEIIRQQDGFLRLGVAHLRPIILRDIAEAVELHESTVSRVTANKYIATPRGTFELKYFFTTAIHGTNGGDFAQRRGGASSHPWSDRPGAAGRHPVGRRDRLGPATGRCGYRAADGCQIPRGAADTELRAAAARESRSGLNRGPPGVGPRDAWCRVSGWFPS